jgi:hypothetical protein
VADALLPPSWIASAVTSKHFREFEAADDDSAVAIAEGWRASQPMELWNRERKLMRWDEAPSAD